MSERWSTDEEKIEWLIDNRATWEDDYSASPKAVMVRVARAMRRAGLYAPDTDPVKVRIKHLISRAARRIEKEESLF